MIQLQTDKVAYQTGYDEGFQYALDNNIDLIRIPYWERDNITIDYILGNKFLIKENC